MGSRIKHLFNSKPILLPINPHSLNEIKSPNTGINAYQSKDEVNDQNDPPKLLCDILINPLTPVTLQHEKIPN